jgi:alkylation response protein AidB-like acyl-CoA dehydrogenase
MEEILLNSLERFLRSHCTRRDLRRYESGESVDTLWQLLEEQGYPNALLSEEAGGAALRLSSLRGILLLLGQYLLPVPLADTMVARALLVDGGVAPPPGRIVLLGACAHAGPQTLSAVLYAQVAQHALMNSSEGLSLVSLAGAEVVPTGVLGSSTAHVSWSRPPDVVATLPLYDVSLASINGALRAARMVGAMREVLSLTLDYANTREQFGRSIGKFQVIQHQLAEMAEHLLGADMAVQLAFSGSSRFPASMLAVLAKQRASAASSPVAAIAHAVHGAIGLSEEYPLQFYVRRLHEWRLADGSESYWASQLGEKCLRASGDALEFIRGHLSADTQSK